MTNEMREKLRAQRISAFEVAEFIKDEVAKIKADEIGRDCSLVAVTARAIGALKNSKVLKEYDTPVDYLAKHITVAKNCSLGDPYYDIIWGDAEGVNKIIGTWIDDTEVLDLRLE